MPLHLCRKSVRHVYVDLFLNSVVILLGKVRLKYSASHENTFILYQIMYLPGKPVRIFMLFWRLRSIFVQPCSVLWSKALINWDQFRYCNLWKQMVKMVWWLCFLLTWGHFFPIEFRERGRGGERKRERERERDISVRQKHWVFAFLYMPQLGLNLKPGCAPWLGIKPANFRSTGWCSNQLSHNDQGHFREWDITIWHVYLPPLSALLYLTQLPGQWAFRKTPGSSLSRELLLSDAGLHVIAAEQRFVSSRNV